MKKLLSEILTDEMLIDIFNKLKKNESYEYSDDNMQFNISPNSISIQYKSTKPENLEEIKSKKVDDFLSFCESMDDELFIEICDTFEDGELNELSNILDSKNYEETINIFTRRAKEIANKNLDEITKAAHGEIERQKLIIANAHNIIDEIVRESNKEIDTQNMNIKNAESIIKDIYAELDRAKSKYSI